MVRLNKVPLPGPEIDGCWRPFKANCCFGWNGNRTRLLSLRSILRGSLRDNRKPGTEAGGARGTRTPDLLHAMQALFQLSYGPEIPGK